MKDPCVPSIERIELRFAFDSTLFGGTLKGKIYKLLLCAVKLNYDKFLFISAGIFTNTQ